MAPEIQGTRAVLMATELERLESRSEARLSSHLVAVLCLPVIEGLTATKSHP